MQFYHTFDRGEHWVVDCEAIVCVSTVKLEMHEMHEYCVVTAGNVARETVSTEGMQQRRWRVVSVVDFDAGCAAVSARQEVKVEEVQLYEL